MACNILVAAERDVSHARQIRFACRKHKTRSTIRQSSLKRSHFSIDFIYYMQCGMKNRSPDGKCSV
eukprot:scaffold38028_cov191-Amphora_coffeaeformis.AAC.4